MDKLIETLRKLKELREKATAGEWTVRHRWGGSPDRDEICGMGLDIDGPLEPLNRGQFAKAADAKFVAGAANTDFSLLVSEAEQLKCSNHDTIVALADLKQWLRLKYERCACRSCVWNNGWGVGDWCSHCENGTADCYDSYPFAPKACSGYECRKEDQAES